MKNTLSIKLLAYIILCSLCLTLLVSSFQLYWDYRNAVDIVQDKLHFIETSYLPAIASSAYDMDEEQLRLQLQGALKIQAVEYLEVVEFRSAGEVVIASQGNPNARRDIFKEFLMEYTDAPEGATQRAMLRVTASLESIQKQLRQKTWIILLTNAAQFFLASFFIFIIIQSLLTRHLKAMAEHANTLSLEQLDRQLILNRKKSSPAAPDELDQVVSALNAMQARVSADIIQIKQSEKAKKVFQSAVDASTDAIGMATPAGKHYYQNEAFDRLFGEIGDTPPVVYVDQAVSREVFQTIMAGEGQWTGEVQMYGADKRIHDILLRAYAIHDEDGHLVNLVGVHTDITDRKLAEKEKEKLETQLRRAFKMEAIGTLAGGIAHDFNNMLAVIIGNTELSMVDLPEGSNARIQLGEVIQASKRASDLVRQILSFSREADQELQPIQPATVIEEVVRLLRATIPSTVEIRQDIAPECGSVIADPTQIHQVLMNLSTNAVYAMQENGVLEIRLESVIFSEDDLRHRPDMVAGPYVKLSVTDTGSGIAEQTLERIFDPFFTTKGVGKGTGMGLSVVHGIVIAHHGMITVDSSPGKGTTFNVYFAKAETEEIKLAENVLPLPTGTERILFVDDEESIVNLYAKILTRLGYQVTTKTSTVEALAAFSSRPEEFDLVITDQTMPNMSGADLTREIMTIRPDIPVILCTGYSSKLSIEEAMDMRIRKFFMKPVDSRDLATAIREILDGNKD